MQSQKSVYFQDENQLLISLLFNEFTGESLYNMEKRLQKQIKWDYFLDRALSHRILPIIYFNLKKYDLIQYVPNIIQDRIQKAYLDIMANNIAYFEELKIIWESFKAAGIEAMILKGIAFAESLYENIGLRMFSDLDMLVHRSDLHLIDRVMGKIGYRISEKYRPIDFYEKYHYHFIYIKDSALMSYIIEIHWGLFPPLLPIQLNLNDIWAQKISLNLGDIKIKTLNWEDTFLYLCARTAWDGFNNLLGFSDLHRVAKKFTQRSWEDIQKKTAELNLKKTFDAWSFITREVLGINIGCSNFISLTKSERNFLKVVFNEEKVIQKFIETDWVMADLFRLFFFKQNKLAFIGSYLFPGERELYKLYEKIPKINFFKRLCFFIRGVKALIHMGYFLVNVNIKAKFSKLPIFM